MNLFLVSLALCLSLQPIAAIKCYHCDPCVEGVPGEVKECVPKADSPDLNQYCFEMLAAGTVSKKCSEHEAAEFSQHNCYDPQVKTKLIATNPSSIFCLCNVELCNLDMTSIEAKDQKETTTEDKDDTTSSATTGATTGATRATTGATENVDKAVDVNNKWEEERATANVIVFVSLAVYCALYSGLLVILKLTIYKK